MMLSVKLLTYSILSIARLITHVKFIVLLLLVCSAGCKSRPMIEVELLVWCIFIFICTTSIIEQYCMLLSVVVFSIQSIVHKPCALCHHL